MPNRTCNYGRTKFSETGLENFDIYALVCDILI